ncbi:tyrosine-type recombinase/integrase [Anaerospora hongkongensis]|uniref:tyrosine-type recombinase/integrase n=1 Tax=Anaerospora hongkongensis TaxID=244830 RepID=UPI00289BA207|nr:site-specific integrase [Anaerospora hongkongensis]
MIIKQSPPRRGRGDRDVWFDEKRKLYVGQLSYTDPKTGKRFRPTVYGKTPKETRDKMKAMERDLEAVIKQKRTGKITLGEWLDEWFTTYQNISNNLKAKSAERQAMAIKLHIKPHIGDIILKRLETGDIQGLYATLARNGKKSGGGLSAQSIRHVHNTLSKALDKAVALGKIKENPIRHTEPPSLKSRKASISIFTEGQVKHLLKIAEKHRLYAAFLAGFLTGLRRGELLALMWDDIDLDRRIAIIRRSLVTTNEQGPIFETPKTEESNRMIPLPGDLCLELSRHKTRQEAEAGAAVEKAKAHSEKFHVKVDPGTYYKDSGLIFQQENGQRLDPRSFSRTFKRLLAKADLPESFRVHDMRHTFASLMLKRGVDIKRIQQIMGHANPEITLATYSHLLPGALEDAAAVLNGLFVEQEEEQS